MKRLWHGGERTTTFVLDAVIPFVPAAGSFSASPHWGGYGAFLDLCELQVDRGDGKGFGLLAFDSTPGYTDTTPFPAAPVKWTYRAIYRVGDAQVGVWSNPVTVTVPG